MQYGLMANDFIYSFIVYMRLCLPHVHKRILYSDCFRFYFMREMNVAYVV